MTCMTRLILFRDTGDRERSEITIYVEDINKFVEWWISTPPLEMKVEVSGDFESMDIHDQLGKKASEVTTA
jgi:hypothetical protein